MKTKSSATKRKGRIAKKESRKAKAPSAISSNPPEILTSNAKLSTKAAIDTLGFLERAWPFELGEGARNAFESLKSSLLGQSEIAHRVELAPQSPSDEGGGSEFVNPLDLIRRTIVSHDSVFLGRRIAHHISFCENLPMIWGNKESLGRAFFGIIEHIVKRADHSSRIEIRLESFALRNGPGVKVSIEINDHAVGSSNRDEVLDSLIVESRDDKSGVSLFDCRQLVMKQRGQMWADIPKDHSVVFHIVLPASELAGVKPGEEQTTFKYDISIMNYANVRKRFGIKKSSSLVTQIEHYIRSLVRYPIDMVMAAGEKGIITTIYETQKGAANSVASRISQRLGKEEFRIGRRPVELSFKYQLSQVETGVSESKRHQGDN